MTRTPDVTLAFQVKGYDIDVGGVVHNSVYLLWLDDIRTAFLEKVQSIEQQVKLGYIPVLSKTEISYKRAVKFGDRPVGRMHLELVSKLRWRISCEFVGGMPGRSREWSTSFNARAICSLLESKEESGRRTRAAEAAAVQQHIERWKQKEYGQF
jgi:acyl-CoA thioesterase FadM